MASSIITKQDIVGARITEVYSTFEDLEGCDRTVIYFTVDRGFSFTIPNLGGEWRRSEVPPTAERLPDQHVWKTFKIESRVERRPRLLWKLFGWILGEKNATTSWTAGTPVPLDKSRELRITPEQAITADVIKRIKQRTILGLYWPKMNENLGFFAPDDCLLLFDDGSQAYCVTVAPHGLGATGLHYRTDVAELPKASELVDFFDVP
jgi:hypothetical protein